ncbi:MAG: thiamine pyrophosphate-binding protein [Actinomycetota bacterium]|nr:thiamine pyrophosphate-binding protein [Actinomycetota bacterium]
MHVADAIGRALAKAGVSHVFGLVGSGNFAVTNALVASGATFVAARHECAAASMADGYARVSGRVGVATVHQGPGLTNAMTGLTEAAKARTPLLLLAADTSAAAVRSNFRIDQEGVAAAVGAIPERIHTAASAMTDLGRAWRTAAVERHAVVLNLPLDVQASDVPDDTSMPAPPALHRPAPSPAAVQTVADLVVAARAPVIIGGRGAVLADARTPLEELGDRIGAMLATSANGNGLFSGSPWSIGISGGFASPTATRLLSQADLVLAFGASLNMWTTRHGALIGPTARVVQTDIDQDAIEAHAKVDAAIVADAASAARALIAELDRRGYRAEGLRQNGVLKEIAAGEWRDQPYTDASDGKTIDPRTLSITLHEALPPKRIVAIDSGHFMGWPAMYLSVPDPAGFVFTQSFQSIGLGLSSAIGAAIARPDRLTVACVGDGGALMAAGEFETIARLSLPMLVVIYNDAAYGAEVHHFAAGGAPLDTVRFPHTDFAALARAVGAHGATIRSVDDLKVLKDWLEQRAAPLVLDAKVTPHVVAEWLEEAFRAH